MSMSLSRLSNPDRVANHIAASEPLAVVFGAVVDGRIEATLLGASSHGPSGTRVVLHGHEPRDVAGLDLVAKGDPSRQTGGDPSGPGDVVVFDRAFVEPGEGTRRAVVGRMVARVHDGMRGQVQVAKALIRPSRHSVSKRGMTQFLSIAEPRLARRLTTPEDMLELHRTMAASVWPGGEPVLVLRGGKDRGEVVRQQIGNRYETSEEIVRRVADLGIFREKGIDILPMWRLPVGREAQLREGDPTRITDAPTLGRVSALYADGYVPHFRPSIVVLCDEEEWAFGAKTGRKHRVAAAFHPVGRGPHVEIAAIPTRATRKVDAAGDIRFLYLDRDELDKAATRRAERVAARAPASAPASVVGASASGAGTVAPRPAPTSLSSLSSLSRGPGR